MDCPDIVGCDDHIPADARARTVPVQSVTVPCPLGVFSPVTVSVFRSTDQMDRGGIVLRITADPSDGGWLPYVRQVPGGAELHMAGDSEAHQMVQALKTALATL